MEKPRGNRKCKFEDFEILSEAFIAGLPAHIRAGTGKGKPPSAGWIGTNWFPQIFGSPNSSHGYTELCPHETDKCAYCCQLKQDANSLQKSIGRHIQQGDQGEVDRTNRRLECEEALEAIEQERQRHRQACTEAEQDYKTAMALHTHQKYCQLVDLFSDWLSLFASGGDADPIERELTQLANQYVFQLGSDYQEEKLVPHWGCSPQPGPTFFMSKRNIHVHILDAPSCGEFKGPTALGKRVIYNRLETDGGSKDANGTLSTVFDYLYSLVEPTCQQPAICRSGYDRCGPAGAAATSGTTAASAAVASRAAGAAAASGAAAAYGGAASVEAAAACGAAAASGAAASRAAGAAASGAAATYGAAAASGAAAP